MTDARYRVLRRLGQGGMAEVFEAELAGEMGFSRKVAIKRMLPDAATDQTSARRFLDEARIASRLHHANIVSVMDVGLLEGLPFQVLELVDGINAQQLLGRAGGTLPVDVALIIAAGVAHALDHAHSALDDRQSHLGIVHRDVKPANVLVSWSGDVKLGDFGIAIAHDRTSRTETGVVAGTSGFIAPEQRARSTVDGRTDVFALGLTLHALVAGYSPLRDVEAEIGVLEGSPIPIDPSIPPDIAAVIARAARPERRERYTAGELADAIGSVLAPRLTRDARLRLREFLEPFHHSRPKPGALDQLLGLEVVLEAEPEAVGAPAEFALRKTAETRVMASPPPTPRIRAQTEPSPTRRRALVILATACVVIAGGGVAVWRFMRSPSVAILPDAAVVDASHPDAREIDAPPALPPPPIDAAIEVDAAPHDAAIAITRRPPRPDAGTAAPAGTGWIQVVGEPVIGAQVFVDGQLAGHVPNPIEVALGHHRVELTSKDGSPIPGAWNVDVTEANTQSNRLRHPWGS